MSMRPVALALACTSASLLATPPEPKFQAMTLDPKIQIGYGVAVADVDGDKNLDVLLADKKQFVWYRNPGKDKATDPSAWTKHLLAENLTQRDNVCIAAEDIDGDGKAEVAVGAEWNPGDTVNSGAVFYLIAPEDRTQPWQPVKFPSVEPTTHRMRWFQLEAGKWSLAVVPLHGRGNKDGAGEPVKVLAYLPPTPLDDPKGEWKSELVNASLHMTHNFATGSPGRMVIGGREGLIAMQRGQDGQWNTRGAVPNDGTVNGSRGVGEVRGGKLEGGEFAATVEPMHGNELVVYTQLPKAEDGQAKRRVLTDQMADGHALGTGDLLGAGYDQIVVGWRGNPGRLHPVGIKLFTALDPEGEKWRETWIDENGMACEDLMLADLDGDGDLDIVASGRATKNVKIYWNETPR